MPDTVLAGQDGQPAIDQATGQPLTIEELLRRRGLLAVNGATRVNGQAPATPAQTSTAATSGPLEQAMAARVAQPAVAGGSGGGATATSATPTVVTNDPNAVAGVNASGPNGPGIDPTIPLVAAGVAGAGGLAYALNKRRKNKNKGTGPAAMSGADIGPNPKPGQPGGGTGMSKTARVMPGTTANRNDSLTRVHGTLSTTALTDIPEGEYTEVDTLLKALGDRRVLKALQRIK